MKKMLRKLVSLNIILSFLISCNPAYLLAQDIKTNHLRGLATGQSDTFQKFSTDAITVQRNGITDGGKSLAKTGFVFKTTKAERIEQLKTLIPEIDRELKNPGAGDLPWYAVISDFHGDHKKMSKFVSIALSELLPGFRESIGTLKTDKTIKEQLDAAGLSLKNIKGVLELNGDLFDRGKNGIRCFLIADELRELIPADKFVYIRGNHCFWAQENIRGRHLPFYEDFNFYGDKVAEELIAQYRKSNPELFDIGGDVEKAKLWWAARLVEYNQMMAQYEKDFKFENGKTPKEEMEKFIAAVDQYSSSWTKGQQDAMENFSGYFKSISVPDPAIGLRAVFKTSTVWWQNLHKQLGEGYEARKNAGADEAELAIWQEAIRLSRQLSEEVGARSQDALDKGLWWARIFESINTQAYKSLEWWAKDWSSHSGWGLEVFAEINKLIDAGILTGPKIDETNYFTHPILKKYAEFVGAEPQLYLRTAYNVLISHGGFPVEEDGSTVIEYKGKVYKNEEIFTALDLLAQDTKLGTGLVESWKAGNEINSWYGDATTRLKPNNYKEYVKIGISKINQNLGIMFNVVGHNIITKLGFSSVIDGNYGLFAVDNGMAPKFESRGEVLFIGPRGVYSVGYGTETDLEAGYGNLQVNPQIIKKDGKIIENNGLDAKSYLGKLKAGLTQELFNKLYNNGKMNIVISGGSGGIGAFIGDRLNVKKDVNVIVGSRSANLGEDIFANEDAAVIADMMFLAVPADADKLESTVKTIAATIKDNAIVVSLAVPMGVDADKNKIHNPASGFASAAEMTQAFFDKYAPEKKIRVVSTLHQVPAEWHGDPDLVLDQKVIVLGDDKEACDQVSEVIKQISRLIPVYKGKLSKSAFAEMVTPWLIQSNKELLEGRTLEEIYDFIDSRNGQVTYDEVMAFNRQILDAQLKVEYGDQASIEKDMQSLFDEKVSEGNKEKIAIRLNRFSQIAIPTQAQLIAPVLQLSAIHLSSDIVFKKLVDVEFEGLVNVVGNVKRAKGAIAVSANAIFENAATLTALKAFKVKQPNIKIVIWANNDDVFAKQFKALDVMKVADIVVIDGLDQAVKKLEEFGIAANQVVVINSATDVEKLNKEFNVASIEDLSKTKGIKFIQLSKPAKSEDGKSLRMNNILLTVSKAYAVLAKKENKVVQKYEEVVNAAAEKHKMSDEDVQKLKNLGSAVSEMKMVEFVNKDEIARKQNSYAATVTKL